MKKVVSQPDFELTALSPKKSPGSKDDSFTDENKIEFNEDDIRERLTLAKTDPNRPSVFEDAANVTPNEDDVDSDNLMSKEPHNEGIKTGSRSFVMN